VEISPGHKYEPEFPDEEYADLVAKNPNRAIQIKNQNHVSCTHLMEQLKKSRRHYPNHELVVYVRDVQVSSVQRYFDGRMSVTILAIP
jgi:hypothetical protein